MMKIGKGLKVKLNIALIFILIGVTCADVGYALRPPLITSETSKEYGNLQRKEREDSRKIRGELLFLYKKIPYGVILRSTRHLLEKYRLENNGIVRWEDSPLSLPSGKVVIHDQKKDYYMKLLSDWEKNEKVDLKQWSVYVNLVTRFIPARAVVAVSLEEKIITLYIPMKNWQQAELWFNCFSRAYEYISSGLFTMPPRNAFSHI